MTLEEKFNKKFCKKGKYCNFIKLDTNPSEVLNFFKQEMKELIDKIETVKNAVRKQTGSFKYDSCYDDCIKIFKEYF